jgi:endonuclease V-like protein UPF0215 family
LLKKETRILGLSATPRLKGGTFVVGVIFRGSSWLDGILTCTLRPRRSHEMLKLSRAIMRSRQYSQLHAVIISSNQTVLQRDNHIAELARRIKLPVILLLKRARRKKTGQRLGVKQYDLDINGERLHVSAKGIGFKNIQELFTVGCTPDSCIPEAVRVADLISKGCVHSNLNNDQSYLATM